MASVDRRPNGQWRARWREYPGGPQRAKHFPRKVDAQRYLAEVQVALARGTYLTNDQQKLTLGRYIEAFLARQIWRPRTFELAERSLAAFEQLLGSDRPLSAIRRGDVQAAIVKLSSRLAPSTVRTTFQHFRTLTRSAMADGLITADPCLKVALPARPGGELTIPTPAQVAELLEAAPTGFRAAVVLGAHVGLRAGEAQGLLVDDIDFLRRTVNVRRQLSSKPELALTEPKTSASVRAVPVPAMVLDELARNVETYGRGPEGVLLHHDGAFLHDNAFNWRWRRTQAAAGLTAGTLRFHSLRHAFASALISAGCSVKAVADAMGHQSPTITLKTYASLWPGDEDRIRSAIAEAWAAEDSLRTGAHEVGG
jgi:integrase